MQLQCAALALGCLPFSTSVHMRASSHQFPIIRHLHRALAASTRFCRYHGHIAHSGSSTNPNICIRFTVTNANPGFTINTANGSVRITVHRQSISTSSIRCTLNIMNTVCVYCICPIYIVLCTAISPVDGLNWTIL